MKGMIMTRIAIIAAMLLPAGLCLAQSDSVQARPDSVRASVDAQPAGSPGPHCAAAPACRPRWEVGLRASSLTDLPGTVTVGWLPGPGWLLDLGLGGHYSRRPYGSGWEINGGVDAALGIKRRVMAGRFFDTYIGIGPGLAYDYEYHSSGLYPDRWMKVWTREYDLSLALLAGVRRELRVWDRQLSVEIGCSPLSAAAVITQVHDETYDRDNALIGRDTDWKRQYTARGALNASAYLGIAYRF
jgi:hypothetical protein